MYSILRQSSSSAGGGTTPAVALLSASRSSPSNDIDDTASWLRNGGFHLDVLSFDRMDVIREVSTAKYVLLSGVEQLNGRCLDRVVALAQHATLPLGALLLRNPSGRGGLAALECGIVEFFPIQPQTLPYLVSARMAAVASNLISFSLLTCVSDRLQRLPRGVAAQLLHALVTPDSAAFSPRVARAVLFSRRHVDRLFADAGLPSSLALRDCARFAQFLDLTCSGGMPNSEWRRHFGVDCYRSLARWSARVYGMAPSMVPLKMGRAELWMRLRELLDRTHRPS
jgi:hypothetical protein